MRQYVNTNMVKLILIVSIRLKKINGPLFFFLIEEIGTSVPFAHLGNQKAFFISPFFPKSDIPYILQGWAAPRNRL